MGVRAHTTILGLEEAHELVLGDGALVPKEPRVDVRKLLDQHQQLLMGKRLQADDWRQHVHQAVLREAPLRETAPQRLVRVEPTPPILHRLGRAAHDDAQVVSLALERVVVHGEHLLVVILPAHRVGNLV